MTPLLALVQAAPVIEGVKSAAEARYHLRHKGTSTLMAVARGALRLRACWPGERCWLRA